MCILFPVQLVQEGGFHVGRLQAAWLKSEAFAMLSQSAHHRCTSFQIHMLFVTYQFLSLACTDQQG